ncbi:MAG: hypothetical protein II596_08800, partial [Thermoguttaceae bacterium]|nr:hypothetical protein [Thermoguttaceae bacterium]
HALLFLHVFLSQFQVGSAECAVCVLTLWAKKRRSFAVKSRLKKPSKKSQDRIKTLPLRKKTST